MLLAAGCAGFAQRIQHQPTPSVGASRVAVDVRGGQCRPEPVVGWFAADGRELVSVGVPPGGATLPPSGSTDRGAYLLADCRSYYLAGFAWTGTTAASYRIALDRAVPPRQMGHGSRIRVLVQDGESGEPVGGATVFWVGERQRDQAAVQADPSGVAWLSSPSSTPLPRFLLVDASDRGYQLTGQHYRLYFDQYVIVLRRTNGRAVTTP